MTSSSGCWARTGRRFAESQPADRARKLEQAATFARTLIDYIAETEAGTAGEALARLRASNHLQQPGAPRPAST